MRVGNANYCAALLVLSLSSTVFGVDWTLVDDSGFSIDDGAWLQDQQRILSNSIALDATGNVYMTANNGENSWYEYQGGNPDPVFHDVDGGITIFKTDGTVLNVKPSDFTDAEGDRLTGAVTKLVQAGDGAVYGLMNRLEIDWDFARQEQRIIRIDPDGTVVSIWSPGPPFDYLFGDWVNTGNKIRGMTVGDDGNIYWTMNGVNSYWREHYFWRYNLSADPPVVEEAPTAGNDQGWGETHRLFDLAFVGTHVGTEETIPWFAVISPGDESWGLSAMSWDNPRWVADSGEANPGFGRRELTAMDYDPARKKLWAGGRGTYDTEPFGQWGLKKDRLEHCSFGNDELPSSGQVIDLGGGNYALQQDKAAWHREAWRRIHQAQEVTLGARFRVDSYTTSTDAYISHETGEVQYCDQATPWIGATSVFLQAEAQGEDHTAKIAITIRYDANYGEDRFKLWDVLANPQTASENYPAGGVLADLGPADSNWHEAFIYVTNVGGVHAAKCYWDGTLVYDETNLPNIAYGEAVFFGASVTSEGSIPGDDATATATFDWVGYAPYEITDVTAPVWPDPTDEEPLPFLDGSVNPDAEVVTWNNIMSRWEGHATATSLFNDRDDNAGFQQQMGVANIVNWHTNSNYPDASGVGNNGHYWLNTIAVNPCTGSAWMSWGAESIYNYAGTFGPVGRVYTVHPDSVGPADPSHLGTDEGAPLAEWTSQVVALTFGNDPRDIYASVVDLPTGQYKLYKATNPGTCCPDPFADADWDGDVDHQDFAQWQVCFTGANGDGMDVDACGCFDRDPGLYPGLPLGDGDVDSDDYLEFINCASGPEVPADPSCDD
jgi:hypothetical protein